MAHALHVDVFARRLVPHPLQHVVHVDLRKQRGGLDGPPSVPRLLSSVRSGGGSASGRLGPGLRAPDGRCVGCDRWGDGGLHHPVPPCECSPPRDLRLLHHDHCRSGRAHARLLAAGPADRRMGFIRDPGGWRGVLGARGRLRSRGRTDLPVPKPPSARATPLSRLGAPGTAQLTLAPHPLIPVGADLRGAVHSLGCARDHSADRCRASRIWSGFISSASAVRAWVALSRLDSSSDVAARLSHL